MRQISEIKLELADIKKCIEGRLPRDLNIGRESFEIEQCDDFREFSELEEKVKSDKDYNNNLVCRNLNLFVNL